MFAIRCRSRHGHSYLAERTFPLWLDTPDGAMRFGTEEAAWEFRGRHAEWFVDVQDAEVVPWPACACAGISARGRVHVDTGGRNA